MTKESLKKFLDDHSAWLQDEENGERADFSTGNWRGVDLHGANLQNAFLSVAYRYAEPDYDDYYDADGDSFQEIQNYVAERTELQGADLSLADLHSADLRGADLSGANLSNANLRGANMSLSHCEEAEEALHHGFDTDYKSYKTDLSGANLSNADLSGANLQGANLTGAEFLNANLRGANLRKANLTNAVLGMADLSGADLTGADLTNADLTNARLYGVKGYNVSSDAK